MGLEEVGIYSVAINISGFLFMFGSILGNVNMPSLSKKWEEESRQEVFDLFNLNIKINAFCLIVFSGFLILLKEQFVSVLYGRSYLDCLPVLSLTLIYSILYSISWTVGGYASLIEKTYIPLITTAIGLGINVLFNLYLIPKFGLIGAGVSSLLAFSINLLSLFIWYAKEGFEFQKGTLWITVSVALLFFNGLYIVLAILFFVCITLGTSLIFNLNEKSSIYSIFVKSRTLYV
jgi:O-antigen/teichoic acid export membrane protein